MCPSGTLIKRFIDLLIDWGRMMSMHTLTYLACEQLVIGVTQLQRKKWARQPVNELCTWG
jgi:hypothetical protein